MRRAAVVRVLLVGLASFSCKEEGGVGPPVEPPVTGHPWPSYHGNSQRTGVSPFRGPQKGEVSWTLSLGDKEVFSSPAIDKDGIVYVGSEDGNLYAVQPNGMVQWKFQAGGPITSSPALGEDGTIYSGCADNSVYALNRDGTLRWRFPTGGTIQLASPLVDHEGIVYISSWDSLFYAINPDGTLKWKLKTGVSNGAAALGQDSTIYLSTDALWAVDRDGNVRWKFPYEQAVAAASSPVVGSDGTIYTLPLFDGKLYALSPSGRLKWTFTFPNSGTGLPTPALGPDGTIYVPSIFTLYALTPTGDVSWSIDLGRRDLATPVVDSEGAVFIGTAPSSSDSTNLYAISSQGEIKFRLTIRNPAFSRIADISTSPAISYDGTLYVVSDEFTFGLAAVR